MPQDNEPQSTTSPRYAPVPPTDVSSEKPTIDFPKIIIGLLLILALLLIGAAYYIFYQLQPTISQTKPNTPTIDRIVNSGTIVIGIDATFPPMEFEDSEGGFVGYDIDLGNRIGEELGVTAEFVNIPWDDLFQALLDGDVDLVLSSVTITDERKKLYYFSEPYTNAGQVIITQEDNTTITATEDLRGKKIGVQTETTNQQQALLYTDPELVIAFDDFIEATQALVNGEVDAIFSDLTGAKGIVDAQPTLKIASDPFTSEYYGVVFRKGESDLVVKVNEIIDSLRQKGVLVLLKQKWLE
jgi:polar amino acid transport system substrate-binding protein